MATTITTKAFWNLHTGRVSVSILISYYPTEKTHEHNQGIIASLRVAIALVYNT